MKPARGIALFVFRFLLTVLAYFDLMPRTHKKDENRMTKEMTMLTIDWKERLKKDVEEFIEQKLPHQDYDFEIIYKAYPSRVNGKIPSEIISFVAQHLASNIGKAHEKYIPFYEHLWNKKGESGRLAFTYIVSRFITKKPEVYNSLIEKAIFSSDANGIMLILDKILLPMIKKNPQEYLPILYKWKDSENSEVSKQAMAALIRILKKETALIPQVLQRFQHDWSYPMTHQLPNHIQLLKAIGKTDPQLFLSTFLEYKNTRDPQTVEILCGSVCGVIPEIKDIVENWTHSGNARLKKAALAAFKILNKKSK